MRRMVAREKARISAKISRFGVQQSPCLRLFTPYYGFAGDQQRREEAKEVRNDAKGRGWRMALGIEDRGLRIEDGNRRLSAENRYGGGERSAKRPAAESGPHLSAGRGGYVRINADKCA